MAVREFMLASRTLSRRTVLGILAGPGPNGTKLGSGTVAANNPAQRSVLGRHRADLLARILSEELRQRWNQPVIVENKPGASGNIGTQAAARANADGLTLLVTVNTFVMNASLFRSIPYDPEKSFEPIAEIATGVLALVVHPSLNVATFPELIALARSKPGEINYASPAEAHHNISPWSC